MSEGSDLKRCSKCRKDLKRDQFHKDKRRKDGLRLWCKLCTKKSNQAGYQRRMSDPSYREFHNERTKAWQRKNPDKRVAVYRKTHLKVHYNMTLEEYDALLLAQNGVCAICENPPEKRSLSVDHNHVTGQVRALLCDLCNVALGNMRDRPDLLRKAADYLEKWS